MKQKQKKTQTKTKVLREGLVRGQPSHDGQEDQQPWSANVYFCLSKKETLDHYKVPEMVQAWIGSAHSNRCSNNLKKKKNPVFFLWFYKVLFKWAEMTMAISAWKQNSELNSQRPA